MRAKRNDPKTSHQLRRNPKKLAYMQQVAQSWVRTFPGSTAMELAYGARTQDTRQIGRRLIELERVKKVVRGKARPCSITGRKAHTWRVK